MMAFFLGLMILLIYLHEVTVNLSSKSAYVAGIVMVAVAILSISWLIPIKLKTKFYILEAECIHRNPENLQEWLIMIS